MNKQNSIQKNIALIFLCIYAGECVLGSSGHWLMFGNVSVRVVLFVITLAVCFPLLVKNAAYLVKNPSVLCSLAFLAFLVYGFVRGKSLGNNETYIWADASSFLGLAVLPCFLVVADNYERSDILTDVIFYSSVVLATVTVLLHFVLAFISISSAVRINDYLIPKSMGGLGLYESGIFRVFFRSQFFLQFAAIIGMKKASDAQGKKKTLLIIAEGTLFFAIIVSFTRGFWMGIVASAVLMFVVNWSSRRELFKTGMLSLSAFAVLLAISCVMYGRPVVISEVAKRLDLNLLVLSEDDEIDLDYFYDAYGFTAEENITAVTIRKKTLAELKKLIIASPVSGYGLGKNLDGLRIDGKTEYMYMDIMMKLGLFGILAFLTLCLYPACRCALRRKKISFGRYTSYAICGFLGVMLTSTFNPFLSTPMGMMLLSAVCIQVYAPDAIPDAGAEVLS